jgi:dTMP kinase
MDLMGSYIAIEGGDGSGKSTVAAALADALTARGHDAIVVREPGSTELGEKIRSILLDGPDMAPWTEAFLFAAQRAQLADEVIGPALADGGWVISDRTYYSSIAYQGGARGLGRGHVRDVNEVGLGRVIPDLVVVLDVDVELALRRQDAPDRIGSEEADFHANVREAYRAIASDEPDRVIVVDSSLPVDDIVQIIMERLS